MLMTRHFHRFLRDKCGLSGLEFAAVMPCVVMLMFGGFEVSQLLQVNRKATNVAATASNLVAATTTIRNQDRDDVFNAASAIMTPFDTANLTIVITSITNTGGVLAVAWSDAFHGQPRTTVPANLPSGIVSDPGTSIIMAETTYVYGSPTHFFFANGFTLRDTFYDRPRRSIFVTRCNC